MLKLEKVLEVKRLLDEGGLSIRAISRQTGVSRGVISAIASGERGLHGRGLEGDPGDQPRLSTVAERCPECGGMVYPPCVLCRARIHEQAETRRAA